MKHQKKKVTAKNTENAKKEVKAPQKYLTDGRWYAALSDIGPDPEQPRKVFDEDKLKELAESIKGAGIVQDLLVEADLAKGKPYWKLLDGERRWRAAKIAGLKEAPVSVREVRSDERLVTQLVSNQQRENLSALEEARAMRREIDSGRHTVESLGKQLGLGRSSVFGRLALLKLTPEVVEALQKGELNASVAALIGTVPSAQQKDLLADITHRVCWDNENGPSTRDVQKHIEEEYCKALRGCAWDLEDTAILPAVWRVILQKATKETKEEMLSLNGAPLRPPAGHWCWTRSHYDNLDDIKLVYCLPEGSSELPEKGLVLYGPDVKDTARRVCVLLNEGATFEHVEGGACSTCPSRSGNLDPESKNPNVCCNVACYGKKLEAANRKRLLEAAKEGQKVLDDKTVEKIFPRYFTNGEMGYDSPYVKASDQLVAKAMKELGEAAPKMAVALDQSGKVQDLVLKSELAAACKEEKVKLPPSVAQSYGGQGNGGMSEEQKKQRKQVKEVRARMGVAIGMATTELFKATMAYTTKFWAWLATRASNEVGLDVVDFAAKRRGLSEKIGDSSEAMEKFLNEKIKAEDARTLAGLAIELLSVSQSLPGTWSPEVGEEFLALLEVAGVDWKTVKVEDKIMKDKITEEEEENGE